MKIYRAITYFTDKDGTPYYKGDIYPYRNEEFITKEHIEYLSSNRNKLKMPVIREEENIIEEADYVDIESEEEVEEIKSEEEVEEIKNVKPRRKRSTKASKIETGDK